MKHSRPYCICPEIKIISIQSDLRLKLMNFNTDIDICPHY